MPVKRRRIGSSSSHMTTQFDTDAAGEPSRSKILTIAYPVGAGKSDQPIFGGFLEWCNYCKKRIAQNSDVFMYSDLCAFCSAECRDLQIALDHSAKRRNNPK